MNERTTLYRVYDTNKDLLYVGISGNPARRLEEHQAHKTWWHDATIVLLCHYPTRVAAAEAEQAAIRSENPVYNVAGVGAAAHLMRVDDATHRALKAQAKVEGRTVVKLIRDVVRHYNDTVPVPPSYDFPS